MSNILKFEYKNWKGNIGIREIVPIEMWYGSTEYHTEIQWLIKAYDTQDWDKIKDFAIKDIIRFM